jgi:hypothetical protein
MPLYLTDPDRSRVRVMSKAEFEDSSPREIQAIFRERHIVVMDEGFRPCKFNRETLKQIRRPKWPIVVNGNQPSLFDIKLS